MFKKHIVSFFSIMMLGYLGQFIYLQYINYLLIY